MKFSTILTSTFFALFILTATATFAADNITTTKESKELIDKEDIVNIPTITGRTVVVEDSEASNNRRSGYTMRVRIMKNMVVLAEATADIGSLALNLEDLDAGKYLLVAETPDGISRHLITLE